MATSTLRATDCPSCGTTFPVDPERVPDTGIHAECSECWRVFFVAPASSLAVFPSPRAADEVAGLEGDDVADPPRDEAPGVGEDVADPRRDEAPGLEGDDFTLPQGLTETADTPEPADVEPEVFGEEETEDPALAPGELPAGFGPEETPDHEGVAEETDPVPEREDDLPEVPPLPATEPEAPVDPGIVEGVEGLESPLRADPDSDPEVGPEPTSDLEGERGDPVGADSGAAAPAPANADDPVEPDLETPHRESPGEPQGRTLFGRRDPQERARRLARVLVSDMIVYHSDRHQRALREGTLHQEFQDEIDKSWEQYVQQVGSEMAQETDYFREALNELLARGEEVF